MKVRRRRPRVTAHDVAGELLALRDVGLDAPRVERALLFLLAAHGRAVVPVHRWPTPMVGRAMAGLTEEQRARVKPELVRRGIEWVTGRTP